MHWIYLSPHFDDAVLSCGGMIWEQTQAGATVEIWTICAGSPATRTPLPAYAKELHAIWQTGAHPALQRRAEDRQACARVGATQRCWRLPDCIYRRLPQGEELVRSERDLWMPIHPGELELVRRLRNWLQRNLPKDAQVVSPMSLGNHVDHRIVRAAAETLRRELYYYPDFPYVAQKSLWLPTGLAKNQLYHQEVSAEGLRAWDAGVAAYESQISNLFGTLDGMHAELRDFWQGGGGSQLWKVD